MLEAAAKSKTIEKMGKIVGRGFVSTNQADLYIYSRDMSQAEPGWPDIVVLPKTVEEVQAVIRFANREKLPVTPYIVGGNVGGLAIPLRGGILLDLKRMNRILEVDETNMYAVVEPGVRFGDIKAYLEKHHPGLIYTYCFSPPSTSIMGNALLQGLDDLSFRYGAASHWTSGMEVVLPTGELVRIGSCAVSKWWQERDPLPDLAGLFLGWQGATGVVTKIAVSLWPRPKHAQTLNFMVMDFDGTYKLVRAMCRTRVPDDIIGYSYAYVKGMMPGGDSKEIRATAVRRGIYPAETTKAGEPECTVHLEISGNTENELKAKREVIEEVVKEELKGVKIIGPDISPGRRADLPYQPLSASNAGGGLTWVGSYGPMSNWLEGASRGCALEDELGFTRSLYFRVMREGHFVALRWLLPFNKEDPDEVSRIRELCLKQLDMVLDLGYIPYKMPVWVIRKLEERADPNWVELVRRVKKMLDPNNIMNPGRWGTPQERSKAKPGREKE